MISLSKPELFHLYCEGKVVAVSTGWKLSNSCIWRFFFPLIMLFHLHLPMKTNGGGQQTSRYFCWSQTQAQLGRTTTSKPFRIKLTWKTSLRALLYKANSFHALKSTLVRYKDKRPAPAEIFILPFNFHIRHQCYSWRLKMEVRRQ